VHREIGGTFVSGGKRGASIPRCGSVRHLGMPHSSDHSSSPLNPNAPAVNWPLTIVDKYDIINQLSLMRSQASLLQTLYRSKDFHIKTEEGDV